MDPHETGTCGEDGSKKIEKAVAVSRMFSGVPNEFPNQKLEINLPEPLKALPLGRKLLHIKIVSIFVK